MANQKPLNFIFFQPDEMRAESLGCYGHPLIKTQITIASQQKAFALINAMCKTPSVRLPEFR